MHMTIVDAHLDLSYNAIRGRAVQRPAREQAADEEGIPTVGLPDLRDGGVGLICATIFCEPANEGRGDYRTADEAHAAAMKQLDWYRARESAGEMQLIRTWPADFSRQASETNAILLLEGADPIRDEADARTFFDAGLRIVGLTWKAGTRYAGGNGAPGPLTPDGLGMVKILDQLGIIHDASHLAEESFWQLLGVASGPVIASHSNCRAIVPGERQLSDEMIRAIAQRGGVIGINFYDKFLLPPGEQGKRRATLKDVSRHVRHICDVAGNAAHVGLGTDMDGGLGREQIPIEIETSADLGRVGDALSADGFADEDVAAVLGGNWVRYFKRRVQLRHDR
ncbi:MAG TPA: membrane dipeptidase [Tepidisphaeraceae bacterium]|nr:membrane dipeptidase [Tepidisphaeraceae bacterium]